MDLERHEVSPGERTVRYFFSLMLVFIMALTMSATGNRPLHGDRHVSPVREWLRKRCPINCSRPRVAHLHVCLNLRRLFSPRRSPF